MALGRALTRRSGHVARRFKHVLDDEPDKMQHRERAESQRETHDEGVPLKRAIERRVASLPIKVLCEGALDAADAGLVPDKAPGLAASGGLERDLVGRRHRANHHRRTVSRRHSSSVVVIVSRRRRQSSVVVVSQSVSHGTTQGKSPSETRESSAFVSRCRRQS